MSFFQVQRAAMAGIQVLALTAGKVEHHEVAEVAALLRAPGAPLRVDIPECGAEAISLLTDVLECRPLAVRDCMHRNRVPRVRIYPHHQLLIMHGPEGRPSLSRTRSDNRRKVRRHGARTGHSEPFSRGRLAGNGAGPAAARERPAPARLAIISALVRRLEGFIEEHRSTHVSQLVAVLCVMPALSALLPTWAKRNGWW